MAKRSDMEKSVLSWWLNETEARISLPMLPPIVTGFRWLPSQLHSVLLLLDCDGQSVSHEPRAPLKALNLGAALRADIADAAKRIAAAASPHPRRWAENADHGGCEAQAAGRSGTLDVDFND